MSYSSVLQTISSGGLGANITSGTFADTPLVSATSTTVSNIIALEFGVWAVNVRLQFTTNGDGTTEIQSLISQSINEAGNQNTNTLIWNGATGGVYQEYAPLTKIYNYYILLECNSNTLNEFYQTVTWTGAGSAPSANVILNAVKLI